MAKKFKRTMKTKHFLCHLIPCLEVIASVCLFKSFCAVARAHTQTQTRTHATPPLRTAHTHGAGCSLSIPPICSHRTAATPSPTRRPPWIAAYAQSTCLITWLPHWAHLGISSYL